ncbi:MAG TPA: AMP-binding protein, partial [Candidatus Babeliales bacterium]|nr:AMP-binding protein [Candidatus Babeliales bacterium]
LYGLLALLKTAPLESVRLFLSGGDVLPDKIRSAFELIYRRKICSGYGLTETSPFVSGDITEETVITTNVGKPLIAIEASFRDENGQELPPNTIGQLWLKGPNIMRGYYNAPEMTAAVIKDGWLNTGDLAYQDAKGRIIITGRMKDIIKHKGFIIYPPEIENVIMTYPNVLQAAVVGKPDVQTGEIPIAFVQLRKDEPDIKKALHELCVKNLANYKVPREFICSTNPLPATATGKIDKKKLRLELNHRTE